MTWLQMCGSPMDLFTVLKTAHDSTNLFIESDTNELVHPKGIASTEMGCVLRVLVCYCMDSTYNLLETIWIEFLPTLSWTTLLPCYARYAGSYSHK